MCQMRLQAAPDKEFRAIGESGSDVIGDKFQTFRDTPKGNNMKKIAAIGVCGVLAVAGLVASASVYAHGRFYGGVVIGGPIWVPPPVYYPPPVYVERVPAPVYVEPPRQDYWYYCAESKAYYPYVQNCPSPWMKVVPNTPAVPGGPPPQ